MSNDINQNLEFIDKWTRSKEFKQICERAESGDKRFAHFVNKFMYELHTLCFHLKNKSHEKKINFQIAKLKQITVDFKCGYNRLS